MRALITGVTAGIGKSIAEKLAKNNFDLVLLARNLPELEKLKNDLLIYKNEVLIYHLDCSNQKEVKEFFTFSEEGIGSVDILVNNVGAFLPANIFDEPDDDFIYQQHLNVNACYYFSKFFGAQMSQRRQGHIFNMCSIASKEVTNFAGSYSVTKAAMLSLNNVLRKELAKSHVKVTAFLPGSTLTASWGGTAIEKNKFVQPEDIADLLYAILNLSSGANVDEVQITPLYFDNE